MMVDEEDAHPPTQPQPKESTGKETKETGKKEYKFQGSINNLNGRISSDAKNAIPSWKQVVWAGRRRALGEVE